MSEEDVAQRQYIDTKIAELGDRLKASKPPFYRDLSTIISIVAFLVSFGTTMVSYKRSVEQDIHSLRSELASTLQKIAVLPKENLEAFIKYKEQPLNYAQLSGYINQENLILSKQADDIIKKLPIEQVSSTDLWAVGLALQASRNFDAALADFQKSVQVATTLDDEVSALRNLASLQMSTGRLQEGRTNYQSVSEIFVRRQGFDDYTKKTTGLVTELGWAAAEGGAGNLQNATFHLANADSIISQLPKGETTDMFKSQVEQTRSNIFGPKQPGNVAAMTNATGPIPLSSSIVHP